MIAGLYSSFIFDLAPGGTILLISVYSHISISSRVEINGCRKYIKTKQPKITLKKAILKVIADPYNINLKRYIKSARLASINLQLFIETGYFASKWAYLQDKYPRKQYK